MDARREGRHKRDEFRRFYRHFDLWVTWYPLDRHGTDGHEHPIYDEGPERRYLTPRSLQVFWAIEQEALHMNTAEGRLPQRSITFGTDTEAVQAAGIDDPFKAWLRIDDVLKFRDEYFSVWQWEPKGHLGLPGHPTVIHVEAHLREPLRDLPDDLFPQAQIESFDESPLYS